jgi:hypothetical protein
LVIVGGCQTEQSLSPSSAGGTNRDRGRTALDTGEGWDPEGWDSVGIDHNRGLSYIDARLAADWDKEWGFDSTLSYAEHAIVDFIKDSTEYDMEIAEMVMDSVAQVIAKGKLELEDVLECLDVLHEQDVVSSREVTYLTRLFQFTFDGDTTSAVFSDSLDSFTKDVLDVEWEEDEILCLTLTGVAVHSWEFRYVGWNWPGQPVPTLSFAEEVAQDIGMGAVGALVGSIAPGVGTVGGALCGALAGSAAVAIHDIGGYFGWW